MKKILVIGKNSFIGVAFAAWLARWPEDYEVDLVSYRNMGTEVRSLLGYDVVFNVAGMITQQRALDVVYESFNRDLAIKVAEIAKNEGVGMMIQLSSTAVYGAKAGIGKNNQIESSTRILPTSVYGRSKLEAEQGIAAYIDEGFKACFIRTPTVYGPHCKGSYVYLRKLALRFGVVPDIPNRRSLIYVGNLCEYVRLIIDRGIDGIVSPCDKEPFCTSEVMEWIAAENGQSMQRSRLLRIILLPLMFVIPHLRRAFGNLTTDPDLSQMPLEDYCLWSSRAAIKETEASFRMRESI